MISQCLGFQLRISDSCSRTDTGRGAGFFQERIADHSASAQHLVLTSVFAAACHVNQNRNEDHQNQEQHDGHASPQQGLPSQAEAGKGLGRQRGALTTSRNIDLWK